MTETTLPRAYGQGNTVCSMWKEGPIADFFSVTAVGPNSSAAWPLAKLVLYYPISLSQGMTVNRMAWINGTVVDAAGHVQVGVYDESFALVGSSASTTPSGTSAYQVVTPTAFGLKGGNRYYLAITSDSTTQTFAMLSLATIAGVSAGLGIMSETTGSFGLPGTATPTVPTSEYQTWVFASSETAL